MASAGKPAILGLPVEEKADLHVGIIRQGHVIGTLCLHPVKEQVRIKQVAIDPAYQGEGLGQQLIEYGETIAATLGFNRIILTGRQPAWGFYEKLGYQEILPAYQEGALLLKIFVKRISATYQKGVENKWMTVVHRGRV